MVTAGDWIIGRTIGSGATATVSLASTRTSGEVFAVKSSPITSSALLQREQSILCSLSSPHIISCLGSDSSTDSYHLFLELAGRGTLSDLAGLVDEPEIRSITQQILLALCYLKSTGFAHCDIKGKNVLIGSDGLVKLGDFGCARRVEANARVPVMGTPAFMAPEAARGEEQGFAGDIWSLGCTVVEMATGRSPWPEITDAVSALYRIGFTSDSPIIPEWISDEGKDFVSKCFVRDPKQRWTAEQLLRHPFVAAEPPLQILLPNEKQGRWHKMLEKLKRVNKMKVVEALVDMYCRCGCVEAALEVFRRVSSKDIVLWNVMIGGLAMHDHDRLAVDLFALMKETATASNESTYIAAMFAQTVHIVLACTKPKMACT
ncbi:Mitogen-activated protein kinase kinase kinase NPK1 [Platanthera zijinensis]|uniref:Mitogen-activated protein kinase kinase kinase NPK1 n=1 Tax=Platanthera zijinensis TaxID=2320716 RepID=A0AAP0BS78_9ASPA